MKKNAFDEKENIEVKIKLLRSYDSTYQYNVTRKTFDIQLTLINKSKKQIKYWTFCCSWQANFRTNNEYINIVGNSCPKNFPIINSLNSKDSLSFKVKLSRNDKVLNKETPAFIESTKIGFLYVDTVRCKTERDFMPFLMDRSLQDKIYWSNPLLLSIK